MHHGPEQALIESESTHSIRLTFPGQLAPQTVPTMAGGAVGAAHQAALLRPQMPALLDGALA